MEKENKFDKMKNIRIDYLTSENFDDLIKCKYDLDIDDLVVCDHCNSVFSEEDIVRDEVEMTDTEDYWDYNRETPEQKTVTYNTEVESCPVCGYGSDYENETFYCSKYTLDMLLNGVVSGLEDYVSKDFFDKLKNYLNGLDENKKLKKCESSKESKMNLQEATIKALYDGLKDDTEINDVEGLVDDVLVVTDPEITTDEYNEVIERAEEIVEETPEGDIPLDPTYLGEYLQLCPICGGSFVEDHILEPGTACPICYETPEAFVMVGKLQAEEEVAEDNGLVDNNSTEIPNVPEVQNVDELGNDTEQTNNEVDTEPSEEESEPVTEPQERPTRVRGARQRREPLAASKELASGNKLIETRINQALIKDRETNKSYTYKELQDMYNSDKDNNVSFDDYIQSLLKTGKYISLTEKKDPEEDNDIVQKEIDEDDYTLELVFEDKIKELANNSAFTWTGMSTDPENLKAIVEDLKQNTNIILPVHFYVFDGRTMNRIYGLTEKNAYPDSLKFVAIDLDNWSQLGNLPFYKMQVGARWLDDIVANKQVRQDKINGIDDEDM